MTLSVKIKVSGNYRAPVNVNGEGQGTVGPNEERQIDVAHHDGAVNTIVIGPEEYLGDKPAEESQSADVG